MPSASCPASWPAECSRTGWARARSCSRAAPSRRRRGAVAAPGNLLILLRDTTAGLLTGRFIVGLGVGLMISAGTAWAGRLHGTPGVTMAGIALATALPMASWTFACVTTSFLVLAARVSSRFESGALLPGLAAAVAFGSGVVAQALGRRRNWGPPAIAATLM